VNTARTGRGGLVVDTAEERSLKSVDWQHLGLAWRSMLETWLMSIMKALWGTLSASVVTMRVKILSVRPTVASAAGTNDLHESKDAPLKFPRKLEIMCAGHE
jgi:hypothetical protein